MPWDPINADVFFLKREKRLQMDVKTVGFAEGIK
jgi:hypothetical protein